MRRWLRVPAFHFLMIGGVLFAANSLWGSFSAPRGARREPSGTIVISAAQFAELRRGWVAQTGRLPGAEEERALVDRAIDEEVLYREALALGLDRGDEVVRRRLIDVMTFLSDEPARDDETLYQEALRLGLDRSDLIVRRHLVQLMGLLARLPEVPKPVTDSELQALLDREADRFRIPAEVTLTHVYLSQGRRAEALDRDALGLLETLRAEHVAPEMAADLGDAFPLSYHLHHASDRDLDKIFGASFSSAVAQVDPGEWTGPIRSSYGEHLVWVHERFPARMPSLASVRTQLLQRLREERGRERLRNRLQVLRARYSVRIEDAAEPRLVAQADGAPSAPVALPQPRSFLGD